MLPGQGKRTPREEVIQRVGSYGTTMISEGKQENPVPKFNSLRYEFYNLPRFWALIR